MYVTLPEEHFYYSLNMQTSSEVQTQSEASLWGNSLDIHTYTQHHTHTHTQHIHVSQVFVECHNIHVHALLMCCGIIQYIRKSFMEELSVIEKACSVRNSLLNITKSTSIKLTKYKTYQIRSREGRNISTPENKEREREQTKCSLAVMLVYGIAIITLHTLQENRSI